jgi:hypothetical protein
LDIDDINSLTLKILHSAQNSRTLEDTMESIEKIRVHEPRYGFNGYDEEVFFERFFDEVDLPEDIIKQIRD